MVQVRSGESEVVHRRYVIAVLSGMRGACIECVCVVPPCWWVSCAGVASEEARVRLMSPTCA